MSNKKRLRTVFTKLFWASLLDKTKLSLAGTAQVLMKWQYLLLAICVAAIFSMLFGVLSVGSAQWNLLVSALPVSDKLSILAEALVSVLQDVTSFAGFVVLLTVLLQGVLIALLVFTIKRQRKTQKEREVISGSASQSTLATIVATLGLGCSACGTSLVIPLISFVSVSAAFLGAVMTVVALLAVALLLYSSWRMGYMAYMFMSIENSNKGAL